MGIKELGDAHRRSPEHGVDVQRGGRKRYALAVKVIVV